MKKGPRMSTGGASNRRLSLGGAMLQTPRADLPHAGKATPFSRAKKSDRLQQNDHLNYHQDDGFGALSAGKSL